MSSRILHLVGSPTSDFFASLSRVYAEDCLLQLEGAGRHEHLIAYVAPGGAWSFPASLSEEDLGRAAPVTLAEAVATIDRMDATAVVPQMFCVPGMTSYRALLEVIGIPYLGNPADVMALTANKARARAVVASAGVRVPEGEVVRPGGTPRLDPPVVVKPVDGDNSTGVSLVRETDGLEAAVALACETSSQALVERFIEPGREVRCGILERGDRLVPLPLEEYPVGASRPIREERDKISQGSEGELALMAKTADGAWIVDRTDPAVKAVEAAAVRCHEALGCRHYSLFDFRIDPHGDPWFLEAGLYCSFARQSVISTMARAAGIDVVELFEIVLAAAIGRDSRRRETPT